MQDRKRGPAGVVHTAEAMPERAAGHASDAESGGFDLTMELVQTVDGELRQRLGIDFRAAVRSGADAVGNLGAVALQLARTGVEQECANRRTAYVDTHNEKIGEGGGGGAHSDFPL